MAILVTTTKNPDLDDLASSYSFEKLVKKKGRDTFFSYYGELQFDAKFFADKLNLTGLEKDFDGKVDSVMLTDDPDLSKLPEIVKPELVIDIIDHHSNPDLGKIFPNASIQIEEVGASSTLIAERWMYDGSFIDATIASLLYYAIQASTFKLRSPLTNIKDLQASDWLEMEYELNTDLVDEMFKAKSEFVLENIEKAIRDDAKEKEIKGKKYVVTQLEVFDFEKYKDQVAKILEVNQDLKKEAKADHVFMNFVDIKSGVTYFIAEDKDVKEILELHFGVEFKDNVAKLDKIILRKQVIKALS